MERIEIRNENGIHFAYFRGIKLPALIKSKVIQDAEGYTCAKLEFLVELQKDFTFEIKGNDLVGVIRNNSDNDNSYLANVK